MKWIWLILGCLLAASRMNSQTYAGPYPQTEISNASLRVKIYLPDADKGFYRGTRFDWSGMVASLEYKGHNYFSPFFERFDPAVSDVVIGNTILAGINSSASGPVEEFISPGETALGYSEAKPGEAFCKIGVGSLRRLDNAPYSSYTNYPILNAGKRTYSSGADFVEFIQQVDCGSGYGYTYTKKISLLLGQPVMTIDHRLVNTGKKPIATQVYDHNFFTLDREPTGPEVSISFPYALVSRGMVDGPGLAEMHGKTLLFPRQLKGRDTFYSEFTGFPKTAGAYQMRLENHKTGAAVAISCDRPLVNLGLWAVRTVVAPEPYIDINIPAGKEYSWKYTYQFYQHLPPKNPPI